MLARIIGVIVTTFLLAALYGFFVTTMDFLDSRAYDPVASGHYAAGKVYGLFGVVSEEIDNNAPHNNGRLPSVARKIAAPYAIVADLTAIFAGKFEIFVLSFFHTAEKTVDHGTVR